MNPLVSIILTSYNKPWFIAKTIESIVAQTYTDWELLIMDDYSDDETIGVIERFLDDPRISFYNSFIEEADRSKTTRYASLINTAIPLTVGKYLTYITDDTVFLPNRLAEMIRFLEDHPDIEIVYSSQHVKVVDHDLNSVDEFYREASDILEKAADIVDHCSVIHTRNAAEQVYEKYGSYWDEDPLHWIRGDAVFWQRLNDFHSFYPLSQVLDVTYKTPESVQTLFRYLPNRLPNGILIKGTNPAVFAIENGQRRYLSPSMLTYFKYDLNKVIEIPDLFLYKYEEGSPIQLDALPNYRLFYDYQGNIYYTEQNQKRRLVHPFALKKYKFNRNDIIRMETTVLDYIPNGPEITLSFSTPLPENKVYKYRNQYWIKSNSQFHPIEKAVLKRLKMFEDIIPIPGHLLKQEKIGEPIVSFG